MLHDPSHPKTSPPFFLPCNFFGHTEDMSAMHTMDLQVESFISEGRLTDIGRLYPFSNVTEKDPFVNVAVVIAFGMGFPAPASSQRRFPPQSPDSQPPIPVALNLHRSLPQMLPDQEESRIIEDDSPAFSKVGIE